MAPRRASGTARAVAGALRRVRAPGPSQWKTVAAAVLGAVLLATPVAAQDEGAPPRATASPEPPSAAVPVRIACSSKPGERQHCPADTSRGVVIARSRGESACLLGKTWGYDDKGIWVSDGCEGEFVVGQALPEGAETGATKMKSPEHIPNLGFRIYEGEKGQIYVRLLSYVRYLNQKGLDPTYVDAFGRTQTVKQREDVQLNKFFLPFAGWFLTPKFRYYLYVWSSNASQGDPAQVVGGGQPQLLVQPARDPGRGHHQPARVRSTEGQFPYWLSVDDRLIADEFFRGSYTSGLWLKGELSTKVKYMAMIGNNLSTLGVSASQLDNTFDTTSFMLQWLPTHGRVRPLRDLRRLRLPREGRHPAGRALHAQHRGQAEPAGREQHREQPDPAHRRQRHLHPRPVRPRHQRREGELPDGQRGRGASSTRASRWRPSTTGAG